MNKYSTAKISTIPHDSTLPGSCPQAKWGAIVNDTLVWTPDNRIHMVTLREQTGIPSDHRVFRDQNSEDDPMMPEEGTIDLKEGNVFYSEPDCESDTRPTCKAPPKLAIIINDKWEIVTIDAQTGRTIRHLFNLGEDVDLFRDLRSPVDQPIADGDSASFADGCVFRTHLRKHTLRIFVNRLPFTERDGVKLEMSGLEIAKLVEERPQNTRVSRITDGHSTPVGLDETIKIVTCDQFKVVRCDVNAGFESTRIERELSILREGGAQLSFLAGPIPAVIYHDVPVKDGSSIAKTDVLVKVPSGYPGRMIDNAFLPAGSPLLNTSPGAVQETLQFSGCAWTQKSIHPHAPNGMPWNKDKHGFHTYYGEIQNWLAK
jgi:hypothetical protein